MVRFESYEEKVLSKTQVARLATVDENGQPYIVPVVFVLHEGSILIPIDEKSKKVDAENLKRVKNIKKNPNVSLLIDEYYDDWSKLYYIMIQGRASIIKPEERLFKIIKEKLLLKYPQYRKIGITDTCIVVEPAKVIRWKNRPT